jgi:hypothetical protein
MSDDFLHGENLSSGDDDTFYSDHFLVSATATRKCHCSEFLFYCNHSSFLFGCVHQVMTLEQCVVGEAVYN